MLEAFYVRSASLIIDVIDRQDYLRCRQRGNTRHITLKKRRCWCYSLTIALSNERIGRGR